MNIAIVYAHFGFAFFGVLDHFVRRPGQNATCYNIVVHSGQCFRRNKCCSFAENRCHSMHLCNNQPATSLVNQIVSECVCVCVSLIEHLPWQINGWLSRLSSDVKVAVLQCT